jgi:hypothetical protein
MESDETFVLDQLQPDQAAELRSIFKQVRCFSPKAFLAPFSLAFVNYVLSPYLTISYYVFYDTDGKKV